MSAPAEQKQRRGPTKLELIVLGAMFVSAFILIVPAIQRSREAERREQSTNNLKQIGMAMQSFHDGNKRLPFNGIAPGAKLKPAGSAITYYGNAVTDSSSSGSWLFQIVPYIGRNPFVRLSGVPESDAIPPDLLNRGVGVFMCPGRNRQQWEDDKGPWSDYCINNYLNHFSQHQEERPDHPDVKRSLLGIPAGASSVIFAGHGNLATSDYAKTGGVVGSSTIFVGGTWGTARSGGPNSNDAKRIVELRRDSAEAPDFKKGGWGGPFPQGGLFVFCDGTVRTVSYDVSAKDFGQLLTPTPRMIELPD
jgi:type II secretory pathway pseudopilin PulG